MNDASAVEDGTLESLVAQVADEFLERLDRGERPDVEEYMRRYPRLAAVLPHVLPALRVMRSLSHAVEPAAPPVPAPPLAGRLGDYRLLRPIGQGGMGVVYEAEQVSLGRRVALKVLPFANTLDAKQLQRFRNEAQAAAHLHHNHIVPVFAVGYERGVHYYAMQFIDGQTLAALIEELRQSAGLESHLPRQPSDTAHADRADVGGWEPIAGAEDASFVVSAPASTETAVGESPRMAAATLVTDHSTRRLSFYRTVAALGKQAAEALEHAHQLGVVHRDIKPANLLVDGRGHLWVADFGLARFHHEGELTLSGDLLGTLRYMSPEQALARRGLVDHRTDVYSLGATLYELLTLHPVWEGTDRRELLRQIAWEEPQLPRRLNKDIPSELETIILKALAKEPAERYATAQELADDLQRFLDDQPVLAQRPNLLQRFSKWVRRHRGFVAAVGGLCFLALAASVVSTVMIGMEQRRTESAYKAEAVQRMRAEANLRLALTVLDEVYLKGAEDQIPRDPRQEAEYREFLQNALRLYEQFAQSNSTEPAVRLETAKAYLRIGGIQQRLGQHDKAEQSFQQAICYLRDLTRQSPCPPEYQRELAKGYQQLCMLLRSTGRTREAEEACRAGLEIRVQVATEAPGVAACRQELAGSYLTLGGLLKFRNQPDAAQEAFEEARRLYVRLAEDPSVPDYRQGLAASYNNLGMLLAEMGRFKEAEEEYRRALPFYEHLVEEYPAVPAYRQELASSTNNLAVLLMYTHRWQEAETVHRGSLKLRRQLADDYPLVPEYRRELATTFLNLGRLQQMSGRTDKAEQNYLGARNLLLKLMGRFPDVPQYRCNLAFAYHLLGVLRQNDDRPKQAIQAFSEAAALFRKMVDAHPGVLPYTRQLGETLYRLALLRQDANQLAEARRLIEQSLGRNPTLEKIEYVGSSVVARNDFAWFLLTCPDEQFRDSKQALDLCREVVRDAPQVGCFWNTLGLAHYRAGEWQDAVAALDRSMQLCQGGDSFDWFILAMAHWRLGKPEQARRWYDRAVDWMEQHNRADEDLRRFREEATNLLGLRAPPVEPVPHEWKKGAPVGTSIRLPFWVSENASEDDMAMRTALSPLIRIETHE